MGELANLRAQAEGSGTGTPAKTAVSTSGSSDQPSRQSQLPNHYCLNPMHDPRLLTEDRFFYFADERVCPVCPVCEKPVNAQFVEYDAKGRPQIPSGLKELASRIGERV